MLNVFFLVLSGALFVKTGTNVHMSNQTSQLKLENYVH